MFLSRREQGRGLLPLSGLYVDPILFFAVKRAEEIAGKSSQDKAAGRAGPEDVASDEKIASKGESDESECV